jgi:hypothetical protein
MIKRPPFDFNTSPELEEMILRYADCRERGDKGWAGLIGEDIFAQARELPDEKRDWVWDYYVFGGYSHDLD